MEILRLESQTGFSVAIETFIDRIVVADTAAAVWDAAAIYFACQGFDRIIYADLTTDVPLVSSTFPKSFSQYYSEVCNPADDPFFRHCCTTLTPIGTGIDYAPDYDYLTASELRIIATAHEAGMRAGFSCTFHKADMLGMGGWNLGSTLGRAEVEAIAAEKAFMLRLAALYIHQRMLELRQAAPNDPGLALSPREHDCLAYLAAGLRTQQIADRLSIQPVTVELHFRRARERLGARTREEALAIALSRGLLRH